MRSYAAVTAHYLSQSTGSKDRPAQGTLELRSALIGFLPIPGRHFAQDLAKGLVYVTDRAGITNKVRLLTIQSIL